MPVAPIDAVGKPHHAVALHGVLSPGAAVGSSVTPEADAIPPAGVEMEVSFVEVGIPGRVVLTPTTAALTYEEKKEDAGICYNTYW